MMENKIAVFGLWHLGTVYAACLAELGNLVSATDLDKKVLSNLSKGILPVEEPGLKELIIRNTGLSLRAKRSNLIMRLPRRFAPRNDTGSGTCFSPFEKGGKRGILRIQSNPPAPFSKGGILRDSIIKPNLCFEDITPALRDKDFIFITFDTRVDDNDIVHIEDVKRAFNISVHEAKNNAVIIISSQLPVGTCRKLVQSAKRKVKSKKLSIVYMPENLRLGKAIESFNNPGRIVLGTDSINAIQKVSRLFKPLNTEIVSMSLASAEMSKHSLNAWLATNISFISEMTDLCEASGANINDVVRALKSDRRVGQSAPINPGFGFSGGTLARDVQSLRRFARKSGGRAHLMDSVYAVNKNRLPSLFEKIKKNVGSIKGKKVCVLGLTYKPGTDTLRRSVSIEIIKRLKKMGASVSAYDPAIKENIAALDWLEIESSPYIAAKGAALIILSTEWPEFLDLDFKKIKSLMSKPIVIDTKNLLEKKNLNEKGFKYIGMGIPRVESRKQSCVRAS